MVNVPTVNNADGIAINTVSRGSGVSPAGAAQHPCQLPEVNENDNGGSNKHPAEAGHGRYRGANQRPGDIAQIHKRLVIAKDASGDAVAAVFQQ